MPVTFELVWKRSNTEKRARLVDCSTNEEKKQSVVHTPPLFLYKFTENIRPIYREVSQAGICLAISV